MYKHKSGARWHGLPRHIRPLFSFIPPMHTLHLIGAVLLSSLLLSCKKEDTPEPEPTPPTPIYMEPITDIDGNVYHTVKIGNQVWTVESLKTTHYRNGDAIPNVTDYNDWTDLTTGAYCDYGNNTDNVNPYGHLYNWYVTNDSRGIAPEGWRVPTPTDYQVLESYLGENAAGKLKEPGTTHWISVFNTVTNETGFTALPGGKRTNNFYDMGEFIYLWTNQESSSTYATYKSMHKGSPDIGGGNTAKYLGYSIRLIKE